MKYLNSIINNKVDIESMVSQKKGFKEVTILAAIPVAILGIVVLTSMIPPAAIIDTGRFAKTKYYQFIRRKKDNANR
jgi:hypothetical protein